MCTWKPGRSRVPAVASTACEHDSQQRTNTGNLGLCRYFGPGDVPHIGDDLNDRISLIAVTG